MSLKPFRNSKTRIALIDADSVLYATALGAEREIGKDEYLEIKTVHQCYEEVCSQLENLINAVRADDAIICLSPTGVRTFRYCLLPTYKSHRNNQRRPFMLLPLQRMIADKKPWGVMAVRGLEADDVCGISSGTLQAANLREPVIVSIDKDLKGIPGLLYSWVHPEDGIVEISGAEADRAHLYQTLVGDSADCYTGCPGIGPKKADKFLDEYCTPKLMGTLWGNILELFQEHGADPTYALTQARVARILRSTDWNAATKEVTLWTPQSLLPDRTPRRNATTIGQPCTAPSVGKVEKLNLEHLPPPGTTLH